MVATGDGEWLWRPLLNPKHILTTSFSMRELRGFGLMQRDRNFSSYEDPEASYELRPSAWIEPVGSWGPGRVEMMQLHTPDETNDNVVAYWVPEKLPAAGQPLDFAYRLHWQGAQQQRPPGAWVVQTRIGRGYGELGGGRTAIHRRFHRSIARRTAGRCKREGGGHGAFEWADHGKQRVPCRGHWRLAHGRAGQTTQTQRSPQSCAATCRAAMTC